MAGRPLRRAKLNPEPRQWARQMNDKIQLAVRNRDWEKAVRSLLSFQSNIWRENLHAEVGGDWNQAEAVVLEALADLG